MANPVFDNALTAITQAMGAVEAEVRRLSSLDVQAQGIQQHIEALRVQERDLRKAIDGLAPQIPASKQAISDAENSARQIVEDAQRQKEKIIADARDGAARIVEEAGKAAAQSVDKARNEAKPYQDQIETAKRELAAMNAQVEIARTTLAHMKQSAAVFASG